PSGSSRVERTRTSVDFPEPFWPRIATHSPRSIVNVTPSSAATRRRRLRIPVRVASRRKNSLRKLWTSTANTSSSYDSAGHGYARKSLPKRRRRPGWKKSAEEELHAVTDRSSPVKERLVRLTSVLAGH